MHFIGIELGIAGTRAVVLDLDGAAIIADAWVAHGWVEGLPTGYREQDPAQWIHAVDTVMRECVSRVGDKVVEVAAISVAGPKRGMVLLDEENRIIRPVKMEGDVSVKKQAEEIARAFGGAPGLMEVAGQAPGADSAAAECLWLKQHEPYHFQRAACFLTPQDFITYWLTGERATEPGGASCTGLLDVRERSWSRELLEYIDVSLHDRLPLVGAPDQVRGQLRGELASAWGLPAQVLVGPGSGAPMLSALAAGCVADGSVCVELGTSGVIAAVGDHPVIDLRGEISPLCSATGSWLGLGTMNNASAAPELVRKHYGWDAAEYEARVSQVSPGADGLLLLPYFGGESIPKLPNATGVLHGLAADNFTPAHFARASAEGVALGLGYVLSRLRDLGFDPPEVRLSGVGAKSAVYRQMLADVLGTSVVAVSSGHGAAMGAAMQAAVCFFRHCGETLGFGEIASYLVTGDEESRCEANLEHNEFYEELMSRQQYLVDTLHPAGFL